jgi:hypothetical protein
VGFGGAGYEEVNGSAGLCGAKERPQCQGEAGASDIDRSRGSRTSGRISEQRTAQIRRERPTMWQKRRLAERLSVRS